MHRRSLLLRRTRIPSPRASRVTWFYSSSYVAHSATHRDFLSADPPNSAVFYGTKIYMEAEPVSWSIVHKTLRVTCLKTRQQRCDARSSGEVKLWGRWWSLRQRWRLRHRRRGWCHGLRRAGLGQNSMAWESDLRLDLYVLFSNMITTHSFQTSLALFDRSVASILALHWPDNLYP